MNGSEPIGVFGVMHMYFSFSSTHTGSTRPGIADAPPAPQYLKSPVISVPNCFNVQQFNIQSYTALHSPVCFIILLLAYIFAHLHILEEKWKIQVSADHRDLC